MTDAELEFERQYARAVGMSVAELREVGTVIEPCRCGMLDCPGWRSKIQHSPVYDALWPEAQDVR